MVESAYASDLKSDSRKGLGVRVPPELPEWESVMTAEYTNYILRGWFGKGPKSYLERVIQVSIREDADKTIDEAMVSFQEDWPIIKLVTWTKM